MTSSSSADASSSAGSLPSGTSAQDLPTDGDRYFAAVSFTIDSRQLVIKKHVGADTRCVGLVFLEVGQAAPPGFQIATPGEEMWNPIWAWAYSPSDACSERLDDVDLHNVEEGVGVVDWEGTTPCVLKSVEVSLILPEHATWPMSEDLVVQDLMVDVEEAFPPHCL